MLIDGNKMMMSLYDWWYSSFGQEETENAKAIHKVLDLISESLEYYEVQTKAGRWLRAGTRHGIQIYQCSECGEEEVIPAAADLRTGEIEPVWSYCPYCGSSNGGKENDTGDM